MSGRRISQTTRSAARSASHEGLLSSAPPNGVVALQLKTVHEGSAHHRIVFDNADKRAFMRHDALPRLPIGSVTTMRVPTAGRSIDRGSVKPLNQRARGPEPKAFAPAGGGPAICAKS